MNSSTTALASCRELAFDFRDKHAWPRPNPHARAELDRTASEKHCHPTPQDSSSSRIPFLFKASSSFRKVLVELRIVDSDYLHAAWQQAPARGQIRAPETMQRVSSGECMWHLPERAMSFVFYGPLWSTISNSALRQSYPGNQTISDYYITESH